MKYLKIVLSIILFYASFQLSQAQIVYEHISNENIYNFLDEMANEKYIELNNAIKPYSRKMVSQKLKEVDKQYNASEIFLNKRQRKELKFYLDAYFMEDNSSVIDGKGKWAVNKKKTATLRLNPPGFFYKDSVFSLAIQPIMGISLSNNKNGTLKHSWGFASLFGYIGQHIGFYGNVRDNDVNKVTIAPNYFVVNQGVIYKTTSNVNGMQFSESRGGITYNGKWVTVGFVKDNLAWGEGYNGTIIQSGHSPSFAHVVLQLKPVRWFEFNYYHGWLASDVVDSTRSYWTGNTYRTVFFNKFMAANMFTFYPVKFLNISFGNSIVYTNENGGGPKAVYFIPFLFFKSVDVNASYHDQYGYASNNNQLYISLSSRNIKHLHLYFSLFADDLSVSYFFDKDKYNSFSYKLGGRLSDFPFKNISFTFEWTRTNPYVYQHHAKTQDYTSNSYNMGYYLRDNSREFFFSFGFKPIRGLHINLTYLLAQHGDDYEITKPDSHPHSDPFLENIIWQNNQINFKTSFEIVSNTYVFFSYNYQNITAEQAVLDKYTPEYYQGKTSTITLGANIGF